MGILDGQPDSDTALELAMQWQKDLGASADATIVATAILFGIGQMVGLNLKEELRRIAVEMPSSDTEWSR